MHKIGIIGHSPEHFEYFSTPSANEVKSLLNNTIDLLRFQYGSFNSLCIERDKIVFNMVCEPGVGLWAAESAMAQGANYHLFLYFPFEMTSEDWLPEQNSLANTCISNAYSMTICNMPGATICQNPYQKVVDDSNFTICYWIGKKQGKTFNAIDYALHNNKMVLDGLHDLKLLTYKDLERKA